MNAAYQHNANCSIAEALRIEHEEIRAALASASAEPGPIGKAAKRVARICLPHFEQEERIVFPIFGLLNRLASDDMRPEMADLLPQIGGFCAAHLGKRHQSFDAAIEALLQVTRAEEGGKFAAIANLLQVHERLENELVYPAVILIGKYLHKSLAQSSARDVGASGRTWHRSGQPARITMETESSAQGLDAFLDELVRVRQPALRRRYSPTRLFQEAV